MRHIPGSLAVGRVAELLFNMASSFWNGGAELDDEDAANLGQVVIVLGVVAGLVVAGLWIAGVF